MTLRDRLREYEPGLTVQVAVLVLLSTALVGGVALAANAFVLDTNQEREGMPYASFEYHEGNATIPPDGDANRTTLTIAQRSGLDVDQANVVVTVNGERAWDVRELDNGSARITPVWTSGAAEVAERSVRIAVYGESLDGAVIAADERSSDTESGEETASHEYLEDGDVVQIVWHSDDRSEMTVLQRYVVGDSLGESE